MVDELIGHVDPDEDLSESEGKGDGDGEYNLDIHIFYIIEYVFNYLFTLSKYHMT